MPKPSACPHCGHTPGGYTLTGDPAALQRALEQALEAIATRKEKRDRDFFSEIKRHLGGRGRGLNLDPV